MKTTRWVMQRAGLLNFWYYDEEIFELADGKLLLRGSNGSGKSVTMQSFLPVLLDGKKTPDRLDPFGSKARRMEDYLLGEKEVVNRDERTGYIFMEYKMSGTEQYITTGIGMQAKRNKSLKSWYFIIKDNRRIGFDFQLSHKHLGEAVPLSAKELENRIGAGGYVVHSQREYMELVNRYVFNFSSIEAYEDLIKLLIQLRSPKLSKDFKPTVIYEILESALPPLTDDELRHLSDTIENMDQASQQLEQLEREHAAIQRLTNVYHTYNQYILAERLQQWMKAQKKNEAIDVQVQQLTIEQETLDQEIKQLASDEQALYQQKLVAEKEKSSLQQHEVWSLEEKKGEKEREASFLKEELKKLENKWNDWKQKLYRESNKKAEIELDLSHKKQKADELLIELLNDAEEAAFWQHEVNLQDYERANEGEYDFTLWLKEVKDHQSLLRTLEKRAEEIDRLLLERKSLQQQSSEQKSRVDEHQKDLDHLNEWFDSLHQQLEMDVFRWMEEHQKLVFPKQLQQEIARSIQGLYEETRFEAVRNHLMSAIHEYEASVKSKIEIMKEQANRKEIEIQDTEAELQRIRTQKMLDPDRAPGTVQYRSKLEEEGRTFLPFYAAVEFQGHVTEEQKERIESALKQTGILDSLIAEGSIQPKEDAVLTPRPQLLGYTLADYLMPDLAEDSPVSKATVDELLRSISLEQNEGGFHIDADGTYSVGCLVGHAPYVGSAKYIGRTSRKRHQREQIQLWTEKLEKLKQEHEEIFRLLTAHNEELKVIAEWKRELPDDRDLLDIHEQINKKSNELKVAEENLKRIDDQWKMVERKLSSEKKSLYESGKHLNIDLTKDELSNALQFTASYMDFLHELKSITIKLSSLQRELRSVDLRIKELEEELDIAKGEENSKRSGLERVMAEIESIEGQLKLKGIEEVRKRIREVQKQLANTQLLLEKINKEMPKKEAAKTVCADRLEMAKKDLDFWSNMNREWKKLVDQEKRLNFIDTDNKDETSIFHSVEPILSKYDRAKISELVTKSFYNEQDHLSEYRMLDYTEGIETPEWLNSGIEEQHEPFRNEWENLKGRRLIQLEYRGHRVNPYYVLDSLQAELEEKKHLLDEQDRELYEDIIVNTVGTILRRRIQRAKEWVMKMDKIMAERDTSSGLTFSIAWKPLTAESEDELDTNQLVQLLQRNSKFLSDEDLEKITKHFRSRIEKAKELIQLRNEGSTLHQVLKEVLDYRKWFTFVLSYTRINEPKRELTNNAFYRFSGGEKAMAMYIPLFTAAYSRYKEAGDMAPYIISLDEAFAGVDENNIRDMFEVVEQLGFNYIMNSQALWGDYDTISSLSICELVRPKNADYVTVMRYHWDGKQKSLVIDDGRPPEVELSEEGLIPNE